MVKLCFLQRSEYRPVCFPLAFAALTTTITIFSAAVSCPFPASAAPSRPAATGDVHQQFQPAKDDDDGDDYTESQELLYQWINPRYSQDERTQTCGIAAYFAVLGAGLCYGRVAARRKQAKAR